MEYLFLGWVSAGEGLNALLHPSFLRPIFKKVCLVFYSQIITWLANEEVPFLLDRTLKTQFYFSNVIYGKKKTLKFNFPFQVVV